MLATLVIASLKVYDVVYVMTNGGPRSNSTQTLAFLYVRADVLVFQPGHGQCDCRRHDGVMMMGVIIIPYVLYTTKDE